MNHGFMSMIRKQKGRVKSGSTVVRLTANNHTRIVQKSRSCSLFFWGGGDIRGVVHHEFVPQGRTVNAAFYVEVLKCLHERV
jgi:hypothetical protein